MTSKDRLIEALEIIVTGLRLYGSTPSILELKCREYIEIGEKALDRKNEENLIAAAPEMLKELELIGHQATITTGHYNRLQRLIIKARGEEL